MALVNIVRPGRRSATKTCCHGSAKHSLERLVFPTNQGEVLHQVCCSRFAHAKGYKAWSCTSIENVAGEDIRGSPRSGLVAQLIEALLRLPCDNVWRGSVDVEVLGKNLHVIVQLSIKAVHMGTVCYRTSSARNSLVNDKVRQAHQCIRLRWGLQQPHGLLRKAL
jgi:hypothetical protein